MDYIYSLSLWRTTTFERHFIALEPGLRHDHRLDFYLSHFQGCISFPRSVGLVVPIGLPCPRKGVDMAKRKNQVELTGWHEKATMYVQLLAGGVRIIVAFVELAQFLDHWSN